MFSFNEAHEASLDYFKGDDLAATVFLEKYALRDTDGNILEKTPYDMHKRMAKELARIEKKKYDASNYINDVDEFEDKFNNALSEDFILDLLDRFKYIVPQGSIMYGIGNKHQIVSLSNCYLCEIPEDSYSDILRIDEQLVNISKRRGGVGIDVSKLRPRGFRTQNASRTSSGIVSFMERYSNSIREVGQLGRRGALLISIDVHHPQILDFIKAKSDLKKVTGANISIKLTKDFMDAVINNKDYEQKFPVDSNVPEFSQMVPANKVFDEIIKQARETAEPGLLMWFNVQKYTPADCYERFASKGTNPCSELVLSPLDSCRLLCLNLLSYVKDAFTDNARFDEDLFYLHSQIAQRLMDDIVDLESECINKIIQKVRSDPEDKYIKQREIDMWQKVKSANDDGRRTGTGITALADTLAGLNIKYGSEKSIKATEQIYKTLKLGCYQSSVKMAKLLGPFVGWDPTLEKDNEFLLQIQKDDLDLYLEMQQYGRRNVSLTTTAPTGSVSILTQTSSGIEPVFMLTHTRRRKITDNEKVKPDFIDEIGDRWQEFEVFHPTFTKWSKTTKKTKKKESPWFDCCAHEIDWTNRVKLQAVAQKHICHGISSTINLPKDISLEEVKKIYLQAAKSGLKGVTIYREGSRSGVLINKNETAKKRPKEILCDVYVISRDKTPFFILIGKLDSKPYEIFAGNNLNNTIDKKIKTGQIVKIGGGKYKFVNGTTELSPISAFTDPDIDCITRLVSTSLRHSVPIEFICSQLDKSGGHLHSVHKAIVRALKNYIKDGATMGDRCPECGNDLRYIEGCKNCTCGWSKC